MPLITPPPVKESSAGFGEVLRNRNFLLLWGGQVFSQLADKVLLVLMIALVSTKFSDESSVNRLVSDIYNAFTIPAILFGSLAGVFVDRWSKRAVLVGTNILRGLLVLTLPFLPPDFAVLLVVTFLVSTLTQFFAPAEQTVIPLIVERRSLLTANSLFTTTMMGSLIVGFAVGEPLLAMVGVNQGHWLVAGGYLLAGGILLGVATGEKSTGRSTNGIWADLKEGLAYVAAHRTVQAAFIQLVVLFSIFAALSVLAVSLARQVDFKPEQFGFLLAAAGVGMVLGAWGLGQFGQGFTRTQLAFSGSVVIALMLVALTFSTDRWLVLGLCMFLGSAAALVGIPMQTVIQEETPPDLRGKVFGLQSNIANIALSVPLVITGRAVDDFGLQPVMLITAALALLSALILAAANRAVKL